MNFLVALFVAWCWVPSEIEHPWYVVVIAGLTYLTAIMMELRDIKRKLK